MPSPRQTEAHGDTACSQTQTLCLHGNTRQFLSPEGSPLRMRSAVVLYRCRKVINYISCVSVRGALCTAPIYTQCKPVVSNRRTANITNVTTLRSRNRICHGRTVLRRYSCDDVGLCVIIRPYRPYYVRRCGLLLPTE